MIPRAVTRRRLLLAFVGTALCLLPTHGSAGPDRMAVVEYRRWKKIFDAYGVVGTAVVYDAKTVQYEVYDPERAARQFTPASTFDFPEMSNKRQEVTRAIGVLPAEGK